MAIHRIIEAQAARSGDLPAISDHRITLTYRELNQRANAVARRLIAQGFRRGATAIVNLPRSPETAVVLLGVLKAGGTYVFADRIAAGTGWPEGVSFVDRTEGEELRYRTLDVMATLREGARSSANLPIISRDSDVACVIPDDDGQPRVLVPHGTVISLKEQTVPPLAEWSSEAGALDLWAGLMNGVTVTLNGPRLRSAA